MNFLAIENIDTGERQLHGRRCAQVSDVFARKGSEIPSFACVCCRYAHEVDFGTRMAWVTQPNEPSPGVCGCVIVCVGCVLGSPLPFFLPPVERAYLVQQALRGLPRARSPPPVL